MKTLFAAAAALTILAAVPASAATYDALSSFNGVNGNGGFSYGFTGGVALTPFDASGTGSQCFFGAGSTCLYDAASGSFPLASMGGSWPTVSVPSDALVLHPGNSDTQSVYSAFSTLLGGTFNYTINLKSVGIDTTDGTGYTPFTALAGVVTLGARGTLDSYGSSATLSGTQSLSPGQQFGVIIDRKSIYYGDSTSLNFAVASVPEPATWGLLIVGFGGMGAVMRRRRAALATA